jgi:hypothetical protein
MSDTDNVNQAFASVFERDDRESGADTAAPAANEAAVPRDEQGRFAPKVEDKAIEDQPKADAPPPDPKPAEPPPEEQPIQHRVPVRELTSEREKRRAAEDARLQAEARAEAYERQLQALMQQQSRAAAPEPPQQPQQEIPDPVLDPQGFIRYQQEAIRFQMADQNANQSEYRARQKYGDKAVDEAIGTVKRAGLAQQFLYRPDPYEDVISWHRRASFVQQVGPDPDAWKTNLEKEIRAKVLEELKAPKPTVSLPSSLADATMTGEQGGHIDHRTMASSVFAREPRR